MINQRDIIQVRSDKSQILHSNPMFLFSGGQTSYTSESAYIVPDHWHEDVEFLCVQEGQMDYRVNGQSIHLNAGEGIFVNSKRIHSNISKKGEFCVFSYGLIHPSMFTGSPYIDQQYIKPAFSMNSFDYILLNEQDWTSEIMEEMNTLNSKPKTFQELGVTELAVKTIRLFYENINMTEQGSNFSPVHVDNFQNMMHYISEHYMEKVSLDDIADAGNVGKTLCAKLFKQFVAKTPGEYLISYRIAKSIELLTTTDLSITDIAYNCGFTSASHYTKTFREATGSTPLKYRSIAPSQSGLG